MGIFTRQMNQLSALSAAITPQKSPKKQDTYAAYIPAIVALEIDSNINGLL